MKQLILFNRNKNSGYSIYKVTQNYLKHFSNYTEYYMPYSGASLKGIINNLVFTYKNRNPKGINHVTGDVHYCILALIGCISVLTVHDTVTLDFNKTSYFKKKIIEYLWFRLPIKFATKVVCISEKTKKEILKYTNRTDIEVIHNSVEDEIECQKFRCTSVPFKVLLIGTKENKNLLRTFEALKDMHCEITIIGKLSDSQLNFLEMNEMSYSIKSDLLDEELRQEYYNTDIVSFCSLYEGFGMPIIEANKAGRIVLCSNIEVLKEVAGDGAYLVDPYEVGDIRRAFEILSTDSVKQQDYYNRGIENAKKFSSKEIAFEWNKFYNTL